MFFKLKGLVRDAIAAPVKRPAHSLGLPTEPLRAPGAVYFGPLAFERDLRSLRSPLPHRAMRSIFSGSPVQESILDARMPGMAQQMSAFVLKMSFVVQCAVLHPVIAVRHSPHSLSLPHSRSNIKKNILFFVPSSPEPIQPHPPHDPRSTPDPQSDGSRLLRTLLPLPKPCRLHFPSPAHEIIPVENPQIPPSQRAPH
jgi:hypothetical protein